MAATKFEFFGNKMMSLEKGKFQLKLAKVACYFSFFCVRFTFVASFFFCQTISWLGAATSASLSWFPGSVTETARLQEVAASGQETVPHKPSSKPGRRIFGHLSLSRRARLAVSTLHAKLS